MSDHPEVKISANALLREMRLLVTAILLISSATWATPTSMSGSSHPAVLTSNPLTLAETAIDDRALVPQSDDVSFRFGQSMASPTRTRCSYALFAPITPAGSRSMLVAVAAVSWAISEYRMIRSRGRPTRLT